METSYYHLFLFPVLFFFIHCLIGYTSATTQLSINTDQSSLLALRSQITSDPHNILTNNWTTNSSICTWIGVTCSSSHQRVTSLDISEMDLGGTLPPQIGNLSFLVSLNISSNSFHGQLPIQLARLRRLESIDFSSNNFNGDIPDSCFGSLLRLQFLFLPRNSLQGNIPQDIGNLPNLRTLRLGFNNLNGTVPPSIFNMSTLEVISLTNNSLSGSLPVDMCSRGRYALRSFFLSFNMFDGEIPSSLYQCSQLQQISFAYNNFVGNVPPEIGNITMLESLYLGDNSFSGTIPREISHLYNLRFLGMERNSLTGLIPLAIFNMSALQILGLGRNTLSGSLPPEIGNLTRLTMLFLNDNNLTGAIPQEIGYIYELERLDLANNSFTHSIPLGIFNMSNIRRISLSQNLLSGNLGTTTGYNLPNLEGFYLNINNLTGPILNSITNCTNLIEVDLSYNQFNGPIPNSLGNLRLLRLFNLGTNNFTNEPSSAELSFLTSLTNCRNLEELSVNNNPLNGFLPHSIGNFSESLRYMSATGCNINGDIPNEIGNLSNLQNLFLGDNNLQGLIPTTFIGLQRLQRLYLSNNQLNGSFPNSLCALQNLGALHMGSNHITGAIPSCLGDIISLRELSLSSNQLESSIPENIWNLLDLSLLNLSSNSLNGPISPAISNLRGAVTIDLSRNVFSGTIPSSIGDLQTLITISLANNHFVGSIPDSMSNMLSLEILDLSQNNLSGVIPRSLETLQYLVYFNVSVNGLSGEIPSEGPFGNFTDRSFMLNNDMCGAPRFNVPPCRINSVPTSRRTRRLQVIFVSLGVLVVIIVVVVAVILLRYKKKNQTPNLLDLLNPLRQRRISYYELQKATDGYNESNLIGKGGFGTVFKGVLRDGTLLAVKVFNLEVEGALKSFDAECEVLRTIRHRNLTKVISSCSNVNFKALVLEYMPKGNLEMWLYSHNYFLDITQRLNIMIDVASAIEYLHHGYSSAVIHCDLKPSNVLLDEDMVAHVSDFGVTRLLGEEDSFTHTRTLATMGYMAPEYGMEGRVSTRSDVYSYGIMLMEVFMRTKPNDERFAGDFTMTKWVQNSIPNDVQQIVDANLINPNEHNFTAKLGCLTSIMELAVNCTLESPMDRKSIKDVLPILKKIKLGFLACIPESTQQSQQQLRSSTTR